MSKHDGQRSSPKEAESSGSKKRFKRKLTPFLCHEMLYDYVTDRLDPDRRAAVHEFIETDKESQALLEAIQFGISYSEMLSQTKLAPDVHERLKESENVISLGRRYSSWSEWPETLRWSITAILISTSIAAAVAIFPWSILPTFKTQRSDFVEVAKIPTESEDDPVEAHESGEADQGSGHEIARDGEETELPHGSVAATHGSQVSAHLAHHHDDGPGHDDGHGHGHDSEDGSPPNGNTSDAHTATAGVSASQEEASPRQERKESKPKGFVYRAFMTLGDLEEIGPKIADDIRELGGAKAGEVELGWNRGTGRYYHFSLPEMNEEKILERLRVYGPVRISKDPHPRVMPQGQVRFILWIESAN